MRKQGVRAVVAALVLLASACGTRLPESAFAGGDQASGGNGARAAGAKAPSGTAGAAPGATTTTAPAAGPADPNAAAATGGGPAAPGGADGPNQASDTGVSENEIVIGNITAQDGVLGAAFKPPLLGLQAFVDNLNDQGGIHGRKVRLETCNDK